MTLRQLEYFVLIAEKGSFTAAAEKARVSQPSMSQHIALLSKELGVPLFEKDTQPLKLTSDGEYLYEKAKTMLASRDQIYRRFRSVTKRKVLNIGVSDVGALIHAAVFPAFRRLCPDTDLILHEGDFATLEKRLRKHDLDILFSSRPADDARITLRKVIGDRMVLALPADDPLVKSTVGDPEAFRNRQMAGDYPELDLSEACGKSFLLTGRQAYKDFQLSFLRRFFEPTITLETEKISTGLSMLESMGGALLLPELYARFCKKSDRLVFFSIRGGTPEWELCLATPVKSKLQKESEIYLSLVSELVEGEASNPFGEGQ